MSVQGAAPGATVTMTSGKLVVNLGGSFCRTGMVEVEPGTKLSRIVNEVAGGAREGCTLKAIQVGVPCGPLVPISKLDAAVDELFANVDSKVADRTLYALDASECVVEFARRASAKAHEIVCGQCTFGREGTRQLSDVLMDMTRGRGSVSDLELLRTLGDAMKVGSLCSNGATAPWVVLSAMEHFGQEFDAHVGTKQCSANVCRMGRDYR